MPQYRIGELANELDCSVEALRYYEREGLLQATGRSSNGYRYYNDAARQQLHFIFRAKAMGFSLGEIRDLLSIRVDPAAKACADVKAIAEHKLDVVDHKISELIAVRDALHKVVDACCGGDVPADHCTILQALETPNEGTRGRKHG